MTDIECAELEKQCKSGYFIPRGEHDPDPTEDIMLLLQERKNLLTQKCDEQRSIHCSTKEYPVCALIISDQTWGAGDKAGADYLLKLDNLERAVRAGYADELLVMLSVIGEQILKAKRDQLSKPQTGAKQ